MASTFKLAMRRMVQWLRDKGIPAAYCYVHENPFGERPNSHILIHLPPQLRGAFSERASIWFQALDGGVHVDLRKDAQRLAKGLPGRLQYMSKGADFLTCRRYGGHRSTGGQGPVSIKRAGVSEFLSRQFMAASKKGPHTDERAIA